MTKPGARTPGYADQPISSGVERSPRVSHRTPWSDLTDEERAAQIRALGDDAPGNWEAMPAATQAEWRWHYANPPGDSWADEVERVSAGADPEATAEMEARLSDDEWSEEEHWHDDEWSEEEHWHDAGLSELDVVRLADVEPERVQWLWTGRVPRGKVTVLEGDPKTGKSTLMIDLAARVTTGSPMPDGEQTVDASTVLVLTAEDGLGDTVRPRFDAAGGDPTRLLVWEGVRTFEDDGNVVERPPAFPLDVERLRLLVSEHEAALVIVDVLNAYLGGEVDTHRDHEVRRALMPLAKMAEAAGAAVVVLRHLNKGGGSHAIYRGGGSIGIAGAARSVLLAGVDPEDETRRVLAVTACNVAALAPSLAYQLVSDLERGCARIEWGGAVDRSSAELLSTSTPEERSERSEAIDFLRKMLVAPQLSSDVKAGWKRAGGGSEPTLQRARRALGVVVRREGFGPEMRSYWSLPDPPPGHSCHSSTFVVDTNGGDSTVFTPPEQEERPDDGSSPVKTQNLDRNGAESVALELDADPLDAGDIPLSAPTTPGGAGTTNEEE
jgi:AAA domain